MSNSKLASNSNHLLLTLGLLACSAVAADGTGTDNVTDELPGCNQLP